MHGKENSDKNVNALWYIHGGETSDEEVIEYFEDLIPEVTMALKGKHQLNILIWDYMEQENIIAERETFIKEGDSWEEADKKARKEAARLKEEAIMYYESCKEYNKMANMKASDFS
jgi:hypothetical protein